MDKEERMMGVGCGMEGIGIVQQREGRGRRRMERKEEEEEGWKGGWRG